jgi:hypothetical protein
MTDRADGPNSSFLFIAALELGPGGSTNILGPFSLQSSDLESPSEMIGLVREWLLVIGRRI